MRAVYRPGPGRQLAELNAISGIDKASILRILNTLIADGFICRDAASGAYQPDINSWIYLTPSLQPGLSLIESVRESLNRLAESTGMTSGIIIPTADGRMMMGPLWSQPKTLVHFDPDRARPIVPYHGNAAGKCLLASLTPAELASYLEQPLERLTDRTITSPTKLRKEVARVARLGYATQVGEFIRGLSSIAVPFCAGTGALTVAIPGEQLDTVLDKALPALNEARSKISHYLSYEGWLEFIERSLPPTSTQVTSPWDTPDPGFGEGPVPIVRSVSRMMRLMAAVFKQPQGVSLGELAERRSLDRTTTWRLLNSLVAGDILWRDSPDHLYRVSPTFWLRHEWVMRAATSLTRSVDAILQGLAGKTGGTAILTMPDKETRFPVICRLALPRTPISFHPELAPRPPLHTTASGKAYLAAQSRLAVERYIRRGLAALTEKTITSRERLLAELDAVRSAGYAFSLGEMVEGAWACAVPVMDASRKVVASLSIVSVQNMSQSEATRWVPLLQDAARSLSNMLVGNWREQLAVAVEPMA